MLLESKSAIVYGGGGSIGGAVARAFAAEGAHVFLAGRTLAKLEMVAEGIRSAGGVAHVAQLDALDERAVDAHADSVVAATGSLDISFNLITHGDVQGTPLVAMTPEDFVHPVETAVRTMFLTSRAAARHMIKQGSGVILVFGGEGDPLRGYNLGAQSAQHDRRHRQHQLRRPDRLGRSMYMIELRLRCVAALRELVHPGANWSEGAPSVPATMPGLQQSEPSLDRNHRS